MAGSIAPKRVDHVPFFTPLAIIFQKREGQEKREGQPSGYAFVTEL